MTWVSEKDAHGEPVPLNRWQWARMHLASIDAEDSARQRRSEARRLIAQTLSEMPFNAVDDAE